MNFSSAIAASATLPATEARADAAPMRRLAVLGVLLVALTLGALALHIPGADTVGTPERKAIFVALLGLAALVQFAAIATVLRGVPRHAVWLIGIVAIVLRIGPLLAPPFLSSDVYRYVWDGRVQQVGINPYIFVPADPALAGLRDGEVYPHINRAETAPTIYPPAAQVLFAAASAIAPGVTGIKAIMVGFEALLLAAAAAVLARLGLPASRIVIWAWNPLAVWAFAGNGHVDAAAAALLAVALLFAGRGRAVLTGIAFAASALTKFLPLAVAPALWPRGGWRFAAAAGVTILALYACYASAGAHMLGFLFGYSHEEGLSDGSGIWLLAGLSHIVALPPFAAPIYLAVAAISLAALAIWVAFVQRPEAEHSVWRASGLLMAAVTVAISPHYPWYFAWLALPAIVAPSRALLWLATAPVLLYLDPFGERFIWPAVTVYLPALGFALLDRRRPLSGASA